MGSSRSDDGGGKGNSDTDRYNYGYKLGYEGYTSGMEDPYNSYAEGGWTNLEKGAYAGYTQAKQQDDAAKLASMFSGWGAGSGGSGTSLSDYAAKLEEQRKQAEREAGIAKRDEAYSARMTASETAIDYVNNEIAQERANYALFGGKYEVTDEQKTARINNYFASLWGEGDENNLAALMKKWGAPKGHSDFTVVRGDEAAYSSTPGTTTTVATSTGTKAKPPVLEEEGLGGGTAILGV